MLAARRLARLRLRAALQLLHVWYVWSPSMKLMSGRWWWPLEQYLFADCPAFDGLHGLECRRPPAFRAGSRSGGIGGCGGVGGCGRVGGCGGVGGCGRVGGCGGINCDGCRG